MSLHAQPRLAGQALVGNSYLVWHRAHPVGAHVDVLEQSMSRPFITDFSSYLFRQLVQRGYERIRVCPTAKDTAMHVVFSILPQAQRADELRLIGGCASVPRSATSAGRDLGQPCAPLALGRLRGRSCREDSQTAAASCCPSRGAGRGSSGRYDMSQW